ncbi:MAG: hypothetical protein AMJ89_05215 [candidate division Zixibacteria bacterium SM23_73]|nr:MAG: hypothetical protein AMJ89_05215 [candidate division Zixibacteria bacterium SM23_73]
MNVELEHNKWQEYVLNKYKEYFDLVSTFLTCAENLQNECVRKEITREKLGVEGFVLSFLFTKSYKTTKAALLLCKSGYAEDALILSRVNFEAALWALYILEDKENAKERAQAFIKYDAIDREKRLKKLVNMFEDGDERETKFHKVLSEIQKELPATEDEYKKVCSLAGKTVSELANKEELLHLLYGGFYWESSNYAHNRIRSANSYVSNSNGHIKFLLVPTEKSLPNILVNLCLFLGYVIDRFNFLLELGFEKTLTEKWAQLNDIVKKTDPQD